MIQSKSLKRLGDVSNLEQPAIPFMRRVLGMRGEIQILAAELDGGPDGLIVTFSDGTTGGYVAEELLQLRPVREPVKIKKITQMRATKLRILVVDDEEIVADSLVNVLNLFGFEASSLYSGSQAIDRANIASFDVLITEVVMREMTGIDAAIEIQKVLPNCKVLLVSGYVWTDDLLKDARERGRDFDILAKPVHPSVIIDRLKAMSVLN
jgi:CheY-like chemotaxis protein